MIRTPHKKPAARDQDVDAKQKAAESPARDDVHEQREPAQEREGVVRRSRSERRTRARATPR